MAIMMRMHWPDATAEQYDELRQVVNWEHDKADGGLFHVAAFDESGAHITDVWESAEQFQRFVDERLTCVFHARSGDTRLRNEEVPVL